MRVDFDENVFGGMDVHLDMNFGILSVPVNDLTYLVDYPAKQVSSRWNCDKVVPT